MRYGLGDTAINPVESYDVVTDSSGATSLVDSGLPSTGPQSGPLITPPLPAIMGGSVGGTVLGTDPNTGQQVMVATSATTFAGFPLTYWLIGGALLFAVILSSSGGRR